jgi:hypothetical protein
MFTIPDRVMSGQVGPVRWEHHTYTPPMPLPEGQEIRTEAILRVGDKEYCIRTTATPGMPIPDYALNVTVGVARGAATMLAMLGRNHARAWELLEAVDSALQEQRQAEFQDYPNVVVGPWKGQGP